MGKRGFKPMLDLVPFVPRNSREAALLEDALLAAGTAPMQALAIPHRLLRHGERGLPAATRTDYRRELLKLDGPPWGNRALRVSAMASTELSDLSAGHPSRRSTAALAELPAAA